MRIPSISPRPVLLTASRPTGNDTSTEGTTMNDADIHGRITALVDEEHKLRGEAQHTDEQRARLQHLEEALDQCWDLLRQREALRDAGADPDAAKPRPVGEVEGYLQ
jgi:hypothetical protein